jgi:hypothetical protein
LVGAKSARNEIAQPVAPADAGRASRGEPGRIGPARLRPSFDMIRTSAIPLLMGFLLGCAPHRTVQWRPQALANGLYEPDPKESWFAGELITINGTNFHYGYFTDVLGVPRPDYAGTIVQLKDHILLEHPKVPNPERISGVLSNRPVLWVWDGYQEWRRLGLDPKPHELLYLRPVKVEPNGAANGSQPFRSETNSTSSAAGSRR